VLVFYSTLEQLGLPCSGPVDNLDVQQYYCITNASLKWRMIDWALKDIPGYPPPPVYLETSQTYNICLRSNKDKSRISQFENYKNEISQGYPRNIF
jgi:hypothetical protein